MPNYLPINRLSMMPLLKQGLDFAAAQTRKVISTYPGYYPMYTVGGKWKKEPEHWTHWCEGFYPGICWMLAKQTGEAGWRRAAERLSKKLEPRRHDRTVHDLGFLFFSTYGRWYRLSGEAPLREVLIEAGRTLALRRQPGGYLASFLGPESLFIDIMMNVGLIFWAANETDDEKLRAIAMEHCRTTAQCLVRSDGSTAHEGIFDPATGQLKEESTQQGYKPNSTWSRGLAWAIYGFTAAHRLSLQWHYRDPAAALLIKHESPESLAAEHPEEFEFLRVAQRCADFYLRRSPENLVPYWDYDAPVANPPLWDSSAGAVAASAFWDLSEAVADPADKERYRAANLTILQTLLSDEFLARSRPGWEGSLLHGVYHKPKNLGVDESVAWGDHFFVEALIKAIAGRSDAAW